TLLFLSGGAAPAPAWMERGWGSSRRPGKRSAAGQWICLNAASLLRHGRYFLPCSIQTRFLAKLSKLNTLLFNVLSHIFGGNEATRQGIGSDGKEDGCLCG
ncbi:hypothetical protein, partial [Klebsiella quasipneumoniae]|uniref:hypothetical protein n=1 Tax=Klebsiella quasipneumoniae TaxID=1463165 RepID=UPI0024BEC4C8